ncbi:MAG: hypothetical protein K9N47_26880 [Prosthecobacter sp.]|uniref:hypothetical protein n=1 Tax=Prosthecobacter sp. TaxID=1965333 RepID=UPI00262EE29A|nr:hypothetical protein [Prosthecobacter sp.]MCF7789776.1 hypothetical protein [Prosthecobacter sp.]
MESPLSNPYASPAANLYGSATGGAADAVSPSTIAQLAGTKPWVRFMSVILWLSFGLLAFFSFSYAVIATTSASAFANNPAFKSNPLLADSPGLITGMMFGFAGFFGVSALLTLYPAVKLWNYASRISTLMATRSITDLESALTDQRRIWKSTGITTLIGLFMVAIGFIAFFAWIATAIKSGAFPQ